MTGTLGSEVILLASAMSINAIPTVKQEVQQAGGFNGGPNES